MCYSLSSLTRNASEKLLTSETDMFMTRSWKWSCHCAFINVSKMKCAANPSWQLLSYCLTLLNLTYFISSVFCRLNVWTSQKFLLTWSKVWGISFQFQCRWIINTHKGFWRSYHLGLALEKLQPKFTDKPCVCYIGYPNSTFVK